MPLGSICLRPNSHKSGFIVSIDHGEGSPSGATKKEVGFVLSAPWLHRARAPTFAQLTQLADTIAHRMCRHLARHSWLEGEDESAFLSDCACCDDGSATAPCVALPPTPLSAKVGGFSLHSGVAAEAHELQKLKCLCGYIARPAISEKRLSISPQGKVRYPLKTPWKNGTTHVEFEPVEFIAKLAARVPPPRAHLTRFLRQRGA